MSNKTVMIQSNTSIQFYWMYSYRDRTINDFYRAACNADAV